MAYLHINNLYKDKKILEFKHCYATEKVHGTSAHIKYFSKEYILNRGMIGMRWVEKYGLKKEKTTVDNS